MIPEHNWVWPQTITKPSNITPHYPNKNEKALSQKRACKALYQRQEHQLIARRRERTGWVGGLHWSTIYYCDLNFWLWLKSISHTCLCLLYPSPSFTETLLFHVVDTGAWNPGYHMHEACALLQSCILDLNVGYVKSQGYAFPRISVWGAKLAFRSNLNFALIILFCVYAKFT